MVTHGGRLRKRKRFWVAAAALLSLAVWYVIVSVSLIGHTKVLLGAEAVATGAAQQSRHGDLAVRSTLGAPLQRLDRKPAARLSQQP